MSEYTVVDVMSVDLVGLTHPEHGNQLWHRVSGIRKYHDCVICGREISRDEPKPFRPMTNLSNRGRRICQHSMARLVIERLEASPEDK